MFSHAGCNDLNFSRREECRKCGLTKSAALSSHTGNGRSSYFQGDNNKPIVRECLYDDYSVDIDVWHLFIFYLFIYFLGGRLVLCIM